MSRFLSPFAGWPNSLARSPSFPTIYAGYLAGCYWLAYGMTGDQRWADLAAAELPGLEPVAAETDVRPTAATLP